MAWRGQKDDILLDKSPTSLLESFTDVLKALTVLVFVSIHYFTFRVLRRFGLNILCSCHKRYQKHLMSTIVDSIGLKENCRNNYFGRFSNKVVLEGSRKFTTIGGAVDAISGQLSEILMANSRCEGGGHDSQCYSSPAGALTEREHEDIDMEQDCKERELYEAFQCERETLAILYTELEHERNCSATAASEALAMISRLQEEKAAAQLEARQFQRMVLEKALYDQEAIEALNEALICREEEKIALEEEICVYRERLDSIMTEERRQLFLPKTKNVEGMVLVDSEQPILIKNNMNNATPGTPKDEQSKCVDKFNSTKSQLLTTLILDGGRDMEVEFEVKAKLGIKSTTMPSRQSGPQVHLGNIKRKVEISKVTDENKPEESGFVKLKRMWGSHDVALKTLEQVKEDRRIEEKRLSVLEYVSKFEQQQQGIRLPIRQLVSKPKSIEGSRTGTHGGDFDESSSSSRKDESTSSVVAKNDYLRRRLFEEEGFGEEHSGEEQNLNGSSCSEVEDGEKFEESPSCIGETRNGINGTEGCVEELLLVHDVYKVQKEVSRDVQGVVGSLHNLGDAELQQTTPSDSLFESDLHTFESDGGKGYKSDQEPLCLLHPSHLHQEAKDSQMDSQMKNVHERVRYKSLQISSSLRRDISMDVEEGIERLTQRLKALEADRYIMKQTIESLRRENGEMKLLQNLAEELRKLGGMEQQQLWPDNRMPIPLQFLDMMSFTSLHNNAQGQLNKLAQAYLKGTHPTHSMGKQSVGLGRLLQHSPKSLPGTCLTRVRKVEEIIPSTSLFLKKEKWP